MKFKKTAMFETPQEVCDALLSGKITCSNAVTKCTPSCKNKEEYKDIIREGLKLYRVERLRRKLSIMEDI
ncbi:hypothetical protein [Serratia sp. D1N4]